MLKNDQDFTFLSHLGPGSKFKNASYPVKKLNLPKSVYFDYFFKIFTGIYYINEGKVLAKYILPRHKTE